MQVFSIDSCNDLTVSGVTIDGTAGNSFGANSDGFDIGSSTGVTITGTKFSNQDDCVAVNSGTVSIPIIFRFSLMTLIGHHVHRRCLLRWPRISYR